MMTRVTQAHIDARVGDILEAARRVFAQKGTHAATMQEVAGEAGLSAGALYRYFANKDDLVRAVNEDAIERGRQLFADAAAGASSPLDALVRSGYAALGEEQASDRCLDLDLRIAALRDGGHFTDVHRELNADIAAMISGLIRQAQAAGEIGSHLDPDLLGRVLLALVNGLRLDMLDPEAALDGRAAIDLVAIMLRSTARDAATTDAN